MTDQRVPLPSKATLALLFAFWTVPGLLCAGQVYVQSNLVGGASLSAISILWYALPVWWLWVPATFAICWLGKRFRIERGQLANGIAVHGLASAGFALLHIGFYAFWIEVAAPYDTHSASYVEHAARLAGGLWIQIDLLVYGVILGGYYAFDYYRGMQERALRASRLEAQRRRSELRALKAQLHPHFLFNTLGAIQTHVLKTNPKRAADMIARLSDFLRMTLEEESRQEVPLAKELAFAEAYLAIEKERMGERLNVKINTAPDTLSALVPHLIVQPLVENAVRHGIAPKEGPGTVCIEAHVEAKDKQLCLIVSDDGVGLSRSNGTIECTNAAGLGFANTETRLHELYGTDYDLQVTERSEGGLAIKLAFPLHVASDDASVEKASAT